MFLSLLPVEKLLNGLLTLDPPSLTRLAKHAGKALTIQLIGPNISLHVLISSRGLQLVQALVQPAQACVQGTPLSLLRMLLSQDAQALIRSGEVTVVGDLELVAELYKIGSTLNIDWEEHLAFFTGDLLASQLGSLTRQAHNWGQELKSSLQQNIVEYVQEEKRQLPPNEEVRDFFAEVMQASLACERLTARLTRLEQYIKENA